MRGVGMGFDGRADGVVVVVVVVAPRIVPISVLGPFRLLALVERLVGSITSSQAGRPVRQESALLLLVIAFWLTTSHSQNVRRFSNVRKGLRHIHVDA